MLSNDRDKDNFTHIAREKVTKRLAAAENDTYLMLTVSQWCEIFVDAVWPEVLKIHDRARKDGIASAQIRKNPPVEKVFGAPFKKL